MVHARRYLTSAFLDIRVSSLCRCTKYTPELSGCPKPSVPSQITTRGPRGGSRPQVGRCGARPTRRWRDSRARSYDLPRAVDVSEQKGFEPGLVDHPDSFIVRASRLPLAIRFDCRRVLPPWTSSEPRCKSRSFRGTEPLRKWDRPRRRCSAHTRIELASCALHRVQLTRLCASPEGVTTRTR